MTLRSDFARDRPDFPLLAAGDTEALTALLEQRQWLAPGERVLRCDRAGEGNMNLTLRVETDQRSFILKQARPWVEKYDDIPAPMDRADSERRFYERVREIEAVAARMPTLLFGDATASVLALEDLGSGTDLTSLYRGDVLAGEEVDVLADYLRGLHDGTRLERAGAELETELREAARLENLGMRALNHEHIFRVPMAQDNGLELDELGPGLADAAAELRGDLGYRKIIEETSAHYLARVKERRPAETCLLHGDYFPGSWLRSADGLRVIDPEFAFPGAPETDVGCAIAHFALADQPIASIQRFLARYAGAHQAAPDPTWLARYAGCEVMRRLIGVAQLPLPPDTHGARAALLLRSRETVRTGNLESLFA